MNTQYNTIKYKVGLNPTASGKLWVTDGPPRSVLRFLRWLLWRTLRISKVRQDYFCFHPSVADSMKKPRDLWRDRSGFLFSLSHRGSSGSLCLPITLTQRSLVTLPAFVIDLFLVVSFWVVIISQHSFNLFFHDS